MLNIRISLTIDMRKVAAVLGAMALVFVHPLAATPANAAPLSSNLQENVQEKAVTVKLTYLDVTTTKSAAKQALSSKYTNYFDAETYAFLTVYAKDWKLSEWKCLRNLWQKESHFNPKAKNMHSGAFGIAQFMPTTWGNYKVTKTADARLQIKYGLRYILKRYGTDADPNGACNAWSFWQKHKWY